MNLEIIGVKDKGDINKERIVLKALSNCDIGYYMLFITRKLKDKLFSSSPKKVYWIPDKAVSKGDLIVIYTKKGTTTENKNASETTSHFYYMGIEKPYFETPDLIAVLIEANGWKRFD